MPDLSLSAKLMEEYDEVSHLFVEALQSIRHARRDKHISDETAQFLSARLDHEFGCAATVEKQEGICRAVIDLCRKAEAIV